VKLHACHNVVGAVTVARQDRNGGRLSTGEPGQVSLFHPVAKLTHRDNCPNNGKMSIHVSVRLMIYVSHQIAGTCLPGHLRQTRNYLGVISCDLYDRRLHQIVQPGRRDPGARAARRGPSSRRLIPDLAPLNHHWLLDPLSLAVRQAASRPSQTWGENKAGKSSRP
jgi:hypothetical protein